ncbi:MAG: hypothetical protein V7L05_06715 [Nostoc sp.]
MVSQPNKVLGTKFSSQCPMPNAQCPMPNAQYPIPHLVKYLHII